MKEAGAFAGLSSSRYWSVTKSRSAGGTMAAMGTPEPAMHRPVVEIRGPNQRMAWAVWIVVSILGAAIGAIVAWEMQSRVLLGPAPVQGLVGSSATLLSAFILAGGQWLVLRHYRFDAFWWVPATIAGNFVAAAIVVPGVINLALGRGVSPVNANSAIVFGAVALATGGLVVGTAQALVLRMTAGNFAWLWIPATMLGGALAGAVTTALSPTLFQAVVDHGLPIVVLLGAASAVGALIRSVCQTPILARILR
jgi:hypothetical protein